MRRQKWSVIRQPAVVFVCEMIIVSDRFKKRVKKLSFFLLII